MHGDTRFVLDKQKVTVAGVQGYFYTEDEYSQLMSVYAGLVKRAEEIEEDNFRLMEKMDKIQEHNLKLRMELRNRVTGGDYQGPTGVVDPSQEPEVGESFRKLSEEGRSGVSMTDDLRAQTRPARPTQELDFVRRRRT